MIMRPLLSLKTLYRSPVRTILTFILLGVVTFAFFSQTAEYAVTAREFNAVAEQYVGVGSAEVAPASDTYAGLPGYIKADPRVAQGYSEEKREKYLNELRYQPLTQEQINVISSLPYITSTDTRHMTAGVSDPYYRLDEEYFYNYTMRCIFEGTLTEVQYGDPVESVLFSEDNFNQLIIEDCKLLAGNLPWSINDRIITISANPQSDIRLGVAGGIERFVSVFSQENRFDTEYVESMTPGNRYVFIVRFDPQIPHQTDPIYYLSDDLVVSWCDAVWPLDGAPSNYLETGEFAPLSELVEITNADMHTFDMVYTEDMRSILRFAEGNMTILDGRALTPEDSANGLNICVVSRDFAEANGLGVGDTITIKLGTELFEQYKSLGAAAVTKERYEPAEKPITLEIVGIYADLDGLNKQSKEANWCYSISTIFVPKSLLPVDESALSDHVFSPAEFSFIVGNAWDISAFIGESAPLIEAMGLTLIFDDAGWPEKADSFRAARQVSLIKIAAITAAVIVATGFVVYLFIGRKKKEYAVMRALGTTKQIAARSLLLPLGTVAATAVLAGSAAAWIYTVKTITQNNTLSMLKEFAVSTTVPVGVVVGCILGEILLTLVIAALLLHQIGKLSPLTLLQDSRRAKERGKNITMTPSKTDKDPSEAASVSHNTAPKQTATVNVADKASDAAQSVQHKRTSNSIGFILRYIGRHLRRSLGKSVLAIVLAALLFVAVGQLALMKQSYAGLIEETVITANFIGLPLQSVPEIINSGYVVDPYYEAREIVDLRSTELDVEVIVPYEERPDIVFTNNIARYTNEEPEITYADGYDATVMDEFGKAIIVGETLMMQYELEPGDTVTLSSEGSLPGLQETYIGLYRTAYPNEAITDEEILALSHAEITQLFRMSSRTYTITGVVSTPSGAYDDLLFTAGDFDTVDVVGSGVVLDVAEFTLCDNYLANEFRSYSAKIAGDSVFIMDTSKLEHLSNSLRLLETLYPIAVAAALIIGGFLCCLVILQSSKEAAILRILGTTKRKTRAILSLEQIFLSVLGLIIGAGALLIYKGTGLSGVLTQLLLFVGLYFAVVVAAAIVCASLATRRNVLELLQTKE